MTKRVEDDKLDQLTDVIVDAMQEKKAHDIAILDLRKLNIRVVDRFIVCHGDNTTQVGAIADYVQEQVKKRLNERVGHREGDDNKEWILLDYFDIVVHVFLAEKREFYALEELWGDADIHRLEESLEPKNAQSKK